MIELSDIPTNIRLWTRFTGHIECGKDYSWSNELKDEEKRPEYLNKLEYQDPSTLV